MRFTQSHEWIELKGSVGTVGITDHAQRELGEIVHVELPKIGHKVKAGQELCVLESTKAAADVYAPVSGKVIEVNEALRTSPGTINSNAEGAGWLLKIEATHPQEYDALMSRPEYQKLIHS